MSAWPLGRFALGVAAVAVAAAVAAALVVIGSPGEQRLLRLDERREHDLQRITASIHAYARAQHALPAALDALARQPGPAPAPQDPATAQPYAYRVIDAEHYELCADFARASRDAAWPANADWHHGPGRQCFRRDNPLTKPTSASPSSDDTSNSP